MRLQQTIQKSVRCTGTGLHSGCRVSLGLLPAPPDTGIVFLRKDIGSGARIRASINNIKPSLLSTSIGVDGVQIQTIEHVLAAAAGLQVDNLIIEVDAPELPALDGSSAPLVDMILKAGIVQQSRRQPYLKIMRSIEVREGEKRITIRPSSVPRVSYTIDYDHPLIRRQNYAFGGSKDDFVREIAPARTFGFLSEVEALWEAGLGLGGSLQNTLILSDDALLNEDGLRFVDEFVRHKVLDLIGDMGLLGMPFIGDIVAVRSGHALHARLVAQVLESRENWMLVSADPAVPAGRISQLAPSLVASPQRD